jgi:ATP-dependent Zn protease
MGIRVLEVQLGNLGSTDIGLMAGGTRFDAPEGDTRLLVRTHPDQMGVVLMAGAAAELSLYNGSLEQSYDEDFKILRRGLGWLAGLAQDQQATVNGYLESAIRAVADHRDSLRRAANALLKRHYLSGDEVRDILGATDEHG